MKKDFLLLIDGSSLLTSSYYSTLPAELKDYKLKLSETDREKYFCKILQTKDGIYTNGIYTMLRIIVKIIRNQNPSHIAIAWDVSRNTFRKEEFQDYKAQRKKTEEPLKQQFITAQSIFKQLGIQQFMDESYEADDFIGSLCKKFENQIDIRLLTRDKDYLQLVTNKTYLWLVQEKKKIEELNKKYSIDRTKTISEYPNEAFQYTPKYVTEIFGVKPEQIADFKALAGDPSDNLTGVKGIGDKTAIALLAEFGDIDRIYNALEDIVTWDKNVIKQYFKDVLCIRNPLPYLLKESVFNEDCDEIIEYLGKDAAYMYQRLTTIKVDIPILCNLNDLKLNINKNIMNTIAKKYDFKSLYVK